MRIDRGDYRIEVRVRDGSYSKIYEREVRASNTFEVKDLLEDLKRMGIDLAKINSISIKVIDNELDFD